MKEGGGRILHSLYTCDVESAHSLERIVNAQYAKRGNKVSVAFLEFFSKVRMQNLFEKHAVTR